MAKTRPRPYFPEPCIFHAGLQRAVEPLAKTSSTVIVVATRKEVRYGVAGIKFVLGEDHLELAAEAAHGGGVQQPRQVRRRQDHNPGAPIRQETLPQLQEPVPQSHQSVSPRTDLQRHPGNIQARRENIKPLWCKLPMRL